MSSLSLGNPGSGPKILDPRIFGRDSHDAKLLRLCQTSTTEIACAAYNDHVDLSSGWHFHEMHQLTLAFDGAVEVEIEGGVHMVPCQVAAWIPAGVPHRMRLHRESSGAVWFPVNMVADDECRVRTVPINPLMREMSREAMRWSLFSPPSKLRTDFFQAMASLCAEWIQNEADLFIPTPADPRLRRALEIAQERWDAKLSDVCRQAGMSERSFRRHLRSEAGLTWANYRHRIRILRAISLLSETDCSVGDIAMQCGFEDASWFSKAFRSTMHELPRDYRNRVRARGSTLDGEG